MQYFVCAVVGLLAGFAGAYLFEQTADRPAGLDLEILSTPEQDALNLPFAEGVRIGDVINSEDRPKPLHQSLPWYVGEVATT